MSKRTWDLPEFRARSGTSRTIVAKVEAELGVTLPPEYVAFVLAQDGGEGFVGENYVMLWQVQDLPDSNAAYQVAQPANGLVLFGSDGGGEAFAFDIRNENQIVVVPFVGMADVDARAIAADFNGFVDTLAATELDELLAPATPPNPNETQQPK